MTENFIKITESMLKTFSFSTNLGVYALISSYSNDNKEFFMSVRDTANYLNIHYTSVQTAFKNLKDKGFIQIVGKKGQRNIYKSVPLDKVVQVQDVSNNSVEVEEVKELTEEEQEEQKRMIQEMSERFKK